MPRDTSRRRERAKADQDTGPRRAVGLTHAATVYEYVQRAIMDGTLAPGEVLREASVAEWCGVSRTPVREALQRLEQDGLVRRTATGMVVRQRTIEETLDMYDARLLLEAAAAKFAAERRTDVDLWQLKAALQAGEKALPDAASELVAANTQFHEAVWRASHSQSLLELLERLVNRWRYPETTLTTPGRWEQAMVEHRALFEAIASRDAEKAYALAEAHLKAARELRLAKFVGDVRPADGTAAPARG